MLPETLVSAVAFGGDMDTLAAIVEGIAGRGLTGKPFRQVAPLRWGPTSCWPGSSIDSGELPESPGVLELETTSPAFGEAVLARRRIRRTSESTKSLGPLRGKVDAARILPRARCASVDPHGNRAP